MSSQSVQPIEWLMAWYRSQCDGDWEHQNSIRIETLDNPGWSLDVDLAATPQAGKSLPQSMTERSEHDWVFMEVKDNIFRARGGPGNLSEMIELFAAFVGDVPP
jgi:hypothetical protein